MMQIGNLIRDFRIKLILSWKVWDLKTKDLKPLEMIDFLAKTNLEWNFRLSKTLQKRDISGEEKIELQETFIRECPIEWYRAYSRKLIQQLKS